MHTTSFLCSVHAKWVAPQMLNRPLTSSSTDISTETGEVDAVLWLDAHIVWSQMSVCLSACPFVCLSVWLKNWIADIANFCSTWHSNVPQTSWRSCQTGQYSCLHVSTYMYHISYMYIIHVCVHVYSNMYMHDSRQVQTGVNELCRDSCVSMGSTTVYVCHSLWHCI